VEERVLGDVGDAFQMHGAEILRIGKRGLELHHLDGWRSNQIRHESIRFYFLKSFGHCELQKIGGADTWSCAPLMVCFTLACRWLERRLYQVPKFGLKRLSAQGILLGRLT